MSTELPHFSVFYRRDPSHTLIDGQAVAGVLLLIAGIVNLILPQSPFGGYLIGGGFILAGGLFFYERWRKKGKEERFEGGLWVEEGQPLLEGPDPLQEQEASRKMRLEKVVVQSREKDGVRIKARGKGAFDRSLDVAPLLIHYPSEGEKEQEAFIRACSASEEQGG